MTNFNPNQFSSSQAAFQSGFAGTDAQEVRQQNTQSAQPQYGGGSFQQTGQQGMGTQQSSFGQFSGPQAAFQSGFAGTDAQEVRQQNAQSAQPQYGGSSFQQTGQQGMGTQQSSFGQFSGSQAAFRPGFAGTDAQEVRQQNAQSAQPQYGGGSFQQTGQQGMGTQQSSFGQFSGPQAAFRPGFAGTDAQEVRQQNAQSAQPQYGGGSFQQTGQQGMGTQQSSFGQFSGPQAAFRPGFAGTDAQEVRQQNAQSAQPQYGGGSFQQTGQQGMGTQQNFGQFSGPQAAFQPGFAGTNAQQARQQNAQSAQPQFFGGYNIQ
ncbi:hypothetical protein [Alkalihalobacillus deserti]|uniref:hypothetical protein n=1 Tax=Alkalihalobacillus deserti TaxID=2879466 RepID=UPI001D14FE05|nr:hypothetical protein [Alkalihalobacillus deserti]